MKLVIENLGFPSVLSAKPVALLGVAAGTIGAIKSLEQLRSVCAHIGAIVLPLPISVPNVQKVFDKESMLPGTETIHWGEQWQARGKSSTVGTTRTLAMSGSEEEVIQLAVLHATTVHGYTDSPELRQQLRSLRARLHARERHGLRESDLI